MLGDSHAFSGYSSNDIPAARVFYGDTLGLDVREEAEGLMSLRLDGGQRVVIYPKEDHQAATFTVLNFEVPDIEAAVDRLSAAGITFERYGEQFAQDARGIARGEGPPIAWFTDPAGNILSLIEVAPGTAG